MRVCAVSFEEDFPRRRILSVCCFLEGEDGKSANPLWRRLSGASGHMPKEAPASQKPQRWEGTHLYSRGNPQRRRTVAQIHEDFARAKGEREKSRVTDAGRRNSLPARGIKRPATPELTQERTEPVQRSPSTEVEEVFFDASHSPPATSNDGDTDRGKMPGSNKKKRNASGGAKPPDQQTNPTGEGIDPCLKGFLLSIKEELQASTREAADRMTEKMDKRLTENEKNIEEIKARLDKRDGEIDRKIVAEVAKLGAAAGTLARPDRGKSRREEAFHFCRRSLKMWPIPDADDLEDGVRVFLRQELGLQDSRIQAVGMIEVAHTTGRLAKSKNEVLATFETKEDRDMVKAAGVNLAGKKDVGMSIHVPGHLLDNFYALNAVGYNIKTKHNGVKRSVKFDDVTQDVYLDICIGGHWKKISAEEAKKVQKNLPQMANLSANLTVEDLSSLLKGDPVAGLTAVVVPDEPDQ